VGASDLTVLALAFLALLVLAYRVYGGWVSRQFGLDDGRTTRRTPSRTASTSSRRGPSTCSRSTSPRSPPPGRSRGRSSPASTFGWLPCLLWIGFGVVFIGAVHDFSSAGREPAPRRLSIAEIARARLGTPAGAR
jgi:carbon starvation protein